MMTDKRAKVLGLIQARKMQPPAPVPAQWQLWVLGRPLIMYGWEPVWWRRFAVKMIFTFLALFGNYMTRRMCDRLHLLAHRIVDYSVVELYARPYFDQYD